MKKCDRCGKESEDLRTIKIDCFYDLQEAIPEMGTMRYFKEVNFKDTFWGITREYKDGLQDDLTTIKTGENKYEIINKPKPVPPIRLLEKEYYWLTVCKDCRADFIQMLKMWFEGCK